MTGVTGDRGGSRRREWSAAALMPLAALVVHQLRYVFTYGPASGGELAGTGHRYLHDVTPWLMALFACAVGALLARLARAWRTGRGDGRPPSFERLWVAATAALIGVYAGQELLEGLLASGHPAGLAGVVGDGGLWSLPASALVGAGVAVWVRGAARVVACVARLRALHAVRPRYVEIRRLIPQPVLAAPPSPLAASAAGRAPPRLS